MSDRPQRDDDGRPTADEMLVRIGTAAASATAADFASTSGWPRVSARPTGCSRKGHRRTARAGPTSSSGFVEAHGRPETAKLLDGLEIVPRRRIEYRGVVVEEMDTDAILARHPAVALVDELAHTNAPGSARTKRWEDVNVLLDAGIDVVSTCNIQHLDSVADAVATITGAPVNERIPDEVLAAADEVELVDMSPYALRQRMRHGNVYPPDRARIALDKFFTEPNLTALRELALRFVAGRVDAQLEGIGTATKGTVSERVLVLVDSSPATPRALRRAAATAAVLRAPLLAVVVETPSDAAAPSGESRRIREYLDDATDLGAEIIVSEAGDLAEASSRSRGLARSPASSCRTERRAPSSASAARRSRSGSWSAAHARDHDRGRRSRDDGPVSGRSRRLTRRR